MCWVLWAGLGPVPGLSRPGSDAEGRKKPAGRGVVAFFSRLVTLSPPPWMMPPSHKTARCYARESRRYTVRSVLVAGRWSSGETHPAFRTQTRGRWVSLTQTWDFWARGTNPIGISDVCAADLARQGWMLEQVCCAVGRSLLGGHGMLYYAALGYCVVSGGGGLGVLPCFLAQARPE